MLSSSAATDHFQLPVSVLTELQEAVIVTDNDDHIVYWNGPAERLYALKAEAVLGHPLERCLPELKSDQELLLHSRRAFRIQREVTLNRNDGSKLFLECAASPLYDKNGLPAGTLWIQRDISERKRLEAEL